MTNKARAVLDLLREGGEWSVKQISAEIERRNPCPACEGTGWLDGERRALPVAIRADAIRLRCRACYGRGGTPFSYSTAYAGVRQLLAQGLVHRRKVKDQWGDQTQRLVFSAADAVPSESADALERAFAAPAFERGDPA